MIPTIAYKPSRVNPLIYCGQMFMRVGYDGDTGDLVREYGIGQHKDGYWGYYVAGIILPKSWKFCTLSDDMQNKVGEPYSGTFYDRTTLTTYADSYVLKWDFQKGGDCEKYIGEDDVQRDINEVIKAITRYELEEDLDNIANLFFERDGAYDGLRKAVGERISRYVGGDEDDA
ncbi:MAG: hypothetical protein IIY21_18785 [Clostridiales bacterium]|jgi:hypothetical protein|nr:hypothetical protein [Clostridiales bacterium]